MPGLVKDIIDIMESVAPDDLAEAWDNVGLQVGDLSRPVQRIRIALDPLPEVVEQACRDHIDLLITHHPLIFRPLKFLDLSSPVGKIVQMAVTNHLAIYSAHTNLDSAKGGINDYLSEMLCLHHTKALQEVEIKDKYKFVVFVPKQHEREVLASLFASGAGKIDAYDCCSFRSLGKGTFLPDKAAKPFIGKLEQLNETDEIRIETIVSRKNLSGVIESVTNCHPYETPAYDIYPLTSADTIGLGRVGELEKPIVLGDFAQHVKDIMGLFYLKVSGDPDLLVKRVAVCSGSGSGLMKRFLQSNAQCYISGDLHYHDARDAQALNRGILDIGHFASEHIMVPMLAKKLQNIMDHQHPDIFIDACNMETDPFRFI